MEPVNVTIDSIGNDHYGNDEAIDDHGAVENFRSAVQLCVFERLVGFGSIKIGAPP